MSNQLSLTLAIIVVTVLISLQANRNSSLFNALKHSPFLEARNNEYYRMLTSGFIHSNDPQMFFFHLFFNMYVLYSFGTFVEYQYVYLFGPALGRLNYLVLYLASIVFASLSTYAKHKENMVFASVGASGGVSGIVFASIFLNPLGGIGIIFIPLSIPAIIFGILYLVYSSYASKRQTSMIDHDAHFAGALFGFAFTLLLKPSLFSSFLQQILSAF